MRWFDMACSRLRWGITFGAVLVVALSFHSGRAAAAEAKTAKHPGGAPAATNSALADTSKPVMFLQEMQVTGSRFPRAYFDSPQPLSFVSRKEVKEAMPNVPGDVLYALPGADNSKDSPWEQRPVLRGLGGQRVLVLMDGDPINSARGNGPHPSLVDPSQIDRIEVVRGPSSVSYGSDALGGVINIITRPAPTAGMGNSLHGGATIGGSTADNQVNGDLQLTPQIGKLTAFISTGARKAEDFETPDNGKVQNSSFKEYNAIANLRYPLSDRTALTAGWQLYRGKDIGLPGLDFSMPGFSQTFNFPYYDRNSVHLMAQHTHDPSSWFASSSAKAYWQNERRNFYSQMSFDNAFIGVPAPGTFVDQTDRNLKLDTYGLRMQASSRRFDRYSLTFGADAARDVTGGDNVDHTVDNDPTGTPYPPGATATQSSSLPKGNFDSYGVFAQGEAYLQPQWTLSYGGRYTHYHYRSEFGVAQPASNPPPPQPSTPEVDFPKTQVDNDALAGSAGLVYSPRADLRVSANVANGYRQPNAQDLFFNGPASVGTVLGNPDLKPEKSIETNVGVRWSPGHVALAGNLFYSTYDDLIDAVQVAPPPAPGAPATYQYVNITTARIWGGEAEGEWQFQRQWRARASVTGAIGDITSRDAIQQLYGVDQAQAPLPGVPPFKGNASLRWNSASGRWWVEPGTRFSWRTNRQDLSVFSTFRKEWIVGDVMSGVRLGSGQTLQVGIRNFTNRAYTLPLASLEEPGVSVVGSLSTTF